MSEMRDRIAKLLSKVPVRDFVQPGGELDQLRIGEAARLVIFAMREPTEAMIDAGRGAAGTAWSADTCVAKPTWQAMIDAALK